jgi:uncharacterized protein YuzE
MELHFVATAHPTQIAAKNEADLLTDAKRIVRYRYDPLFDCLHLADISPIGVRGKYWSGMTLTEQQGVAFVIAIDEYGRCIGFEFFDAAELLLPHLLPGEFEMTDFRTNLIVDYCADTDVMKLGNGKQAIYSEAVTGGRYRRLDY